MTITNKQRSKYISQTKVFEDIELDLFWRYENVRCIFNKEFTEFKYFTNNERYQDETKWDLEECLYFDNKYRNLTKKEVKESIKDFFTSYKVQK